MATIQPLPECVTGLVPDPEAPFLLDDPLTYLAQTHEVKMSKDPSHKENFPFRVRIH